MAFIERAKAAHDAGKTKLALEEFWNARDYMARSKEPRCKEWALKADQMIGALGGVRIYADAPSVASAKPEPDWAESMRAQQEALEPKKGIG